MLVQAAVQPHDQDVLPPRLTRAAGQRLRSGDAAGQIAIAGPPIPVITRITTAPTAVSICAAISSRRFPDR